VNFKFCFDLTNTGRCSKGIAVRLGGRSVRHALLLNALEPSVSAAPNTVSPPIRFPRDTVPLCTHIAARRSRYNIVSGRHAVSEEEQRRS
jgi:hypothetical protein